MVFSRKRRLSLFLLFFSAMVLLHAPHVACADDNVDVDIDEDIVIDINNG